MWLAVEHVIILDFRQFCPNGQKLSIARCTKAQLCRDAFGRRTETEAFHSDSLRERRCWTKRKTHFKLLAQHRFKTSVPRWYRLEMSPRLVNDDSLQRFCFPSRYDIYDRVQQSRRAGNYFIHSFCRTEPWLVTARSRQKNCLPACFLNMLWRLLHNESNLLSITMLNFCHSLIFRQMDVVYF